MELIKVENVSGIQFVDARDLHRSLEVGRDFSNWIKERIEKYGFVEGKDFTPVTAKSTGPRARVPNTGKIRDYSKAGDESKSGAI